MSLKKLKVFNKSCIFPNCLYKGTTGLYRFPISDKNRLDLWLDVCKLSSVRPHELICKNHFHPTDFCYGSGRNCLKKSAVPHWNNSVSKFYQVRCDEAKKVSKYG